MSEGQQLLLVLAILYFSDCFFWLRHHSAVLVKTARRGWEMRRSGRLLINQHGRAVMLNPLPWLEAAYQVEPLAISLSPYGILGWIPSAAGATDRPLQSGVLVRWDEVENPRAEDEYLWIGDRKIARCHCKGRARQAAACVEQIAAVSPDQRAKAIAREFVLEFDGKAIRARAEAARVASAWTRYLGRLLFFSMFLAVPLVSTLYGFLHTLIPLAIFLFCMVIAVTVAYVRAHRRLYPGRIAERVGHALIQCISWPMAIRAADAVTRHALEGFHPLAVARELMPGEAFNVYAVECLRDVQHPLAFDHLDGDAQNIVRWKLDFERAFLQDWLGEAFHVPVPDLDEGDVSYCPRCLAAYTLSEGECPACPGVRLQTP